MCRGPLIHAREFSAASSLDAGATENPAGSYKRSTSTEKHRRRGHDSTADGTARDSSTIYVRIRNHLLLPENTGESVSVPRQSVPPRLYATTILCAPFLNVKSLWNVVIPFDY